MSRGPGPKGAREREKKMKMKNRKEKIRKEKGRKEKREQNFSNTVPGRGPTRYIPMSLSGQEKIPKSNIGNHNTIFEI